MLVSGQCHRPLVKMSTSTRHRREAVKGSVKSVQQVVPFKLTAADKGKEKGALRANAVHCCPCSRHCCFAGTGPSSAYHLNCHCYSRRLLRRMAFQACSRGQWRLWSVAKWMTKGARWKTIQQQRGILHLHQSSSLNSRVLGLNRSVGLD